jgi:hypothetical protein
MQTQSNKLDFSGQNIYIGFDVRLKDWGLGFGIPRSRESCFLDSCRYSFFDSHRLPCAYAGASAQA